MSQEGALDSGEMRPLSSYRLDTEGGMRHSARAGVGAVRIGCASSSKSPGHSCQWRLLAPPAQGQLAHGRHAAIRSSTVDPSMPAQNRRRVKEAPQ